VAQSSHLSRGSRRFAGAADQRVAFEVDGHDAETGTAWSVVFQGTATEVVRLYDVLEVLVELPIYPWHSSQKPHVIRIWPDSITGRRFQVLDDAPTNSARSDPLRGRGVAAMTTRHEATRHRDHLK
jgi:Pyridoxamine 5'-phosphate oxidase